MGKANRTHTPAFKAQVALAAIKGDRTIYNPIYELQPTAAEPAGTEPPGGDGSSGNGSPIH